MQDFLARIVCKVHIFHFHLSGDARKFDDAARRFIFDFLVQNFSGALESGDGFGDLRSDSYDLKYGGNQEAQEDGVGQKGAQGHGAGKNSVGAHEHDYRAN